MTTRGSGRRRVAIVGVGFSPRGRALGLSNLQMSAMSTKAALADAGLSRDDIDGIGIYHTPTANQSTSSVSAALMLGLSHIKWFMTGIEGPAFLSSAIPAIDAVS